MRPNVQFQFRPLADLEALFANLNLEAMVAHQDRILRRHDHVAAFTREPRKVGHVHGARDQDGVEPGIELLKVSDQGLTADCKVIHGGGECWR